MNKKIIISVVLITPSWVGLDLQPITSCQTIWGEEQVERWRLGKGGQTRTQLYSELVFAGHKDCRRDFNRMRSHIMLNRCLQIVKHCRPFQELLRNERRWSPTAVICLCWLKRDSLHNKPLVMSSGERCSLFLPIISNQQKNPHISRCVERRNHAQPRRHSNLQTDSLCADTKTQTTRSRRLIWKKKFDTIRSKPDSFSATRRLRLIYGEIERWSWRDATHTISNNDGKNSVGVVWRTASWQARNLNGKREKVQRFSGPSVSAPPPEDTNLTNWSKVFLAAFDTNASRKELLARLV